MAKLVVSEFISVDGVMEDPGGSEGSARGGWAFQFNRGAEGDKFKLDETLSSAALLLGRVTYEGFAAAWPSRKNEFADKFNSMPKYVVSSTLERASWNNSTVLRGNVVAEISKLRQRLDGDIVVHGSARLVQTLVEHDLVATQATRSACGSRTRRRSVTGSSSSSTSRDPKGSNAGIRPSQHNFAYHAGAFRA